MRFVDTHAHLDFPQFDIDRLDLIAKLTEREIDVICISTSLESVEAVTALASNNDRIWGLVGVHPTDVTSDVVVRLPELLAGWDEAFASNRKIVGIGEIGLDYFHDQSAGAAKVQQAALRQILTLAHEKDYPVSFHCRDAYGDLLTILADYPGLRGVMHCFSGNQEQANSFLALGLHLSFTAIITYPKNVDLQEVVKAVPLDKMLVETDCPFLPPHDKRGQRNDPTTVIAVAEKIAELKNIAPVEVAEATSLAADRLFHLQNS